MGCNCGKKQTTTASTQTYELRTPDGATTTHNSRLEAEAENARRGGGGKVVAR